MVSGPLAGGVITIGVGPLAAGRGRRCSEGMTADNWLREGSFIPFSTKGVLVGHGTGKAARRGDSQVQGALPSHLATAGKNFLVTARALRISLPFCLSSPASGSQENQEFSSQGMGRSA